MTSLEMSVVFAKTQVWNKLSWTLVSLYVNEGDNQLNIPLGHLSGEQIYNKRIYLYASLKEETKTTLVLQVRNDAFAPKQDW